MFDLPTNTKKDLQVYQQFHQNLLNHGFYMIQYSIYARLCLNHDEVVKVIAIFQNLAPKKGNVRCLTVTESQYQSMLLLTGEESYQEKMTNTKTIIEL